MKTFFLILNFPRWLPFVICYVFSSNKNVVKEDLFRFINYGVKRDRGNLFKSMVYLLLYQKEYRFVFLYRQPVLLKVLLGILMPPLKSLEIVTKSNNIGTGLLVVHGLSTIINAEKIGKNLTIYQQCTIGYAKAGKPTIGDNVYIYAGAIVVGDIEIGDNVVIGAGAVVHKSIPANSVVVGTGYRLINR